MAHMTPIIDSLMGGGRLLGARFVQLVQNRQELEKCRGL